MKSNLRVPEEVQSAGYAANRTARTAASSRWMTIFARLGYAAKGIVYLIIGWLAVQVAIGTGGKTTDQRGALQTIYEQPFGKFLLALVIIGLIGFAIWCFLQAWFDTEGKGSDIKGMIGRFGYAVAGVSYAILAFGAFQLDTRMGTSSATKSTTASTQDVNAQLLNHSWGVAAVQHNPHEAKGLDAALRTLAQQPYGPVLLGIVALGLVAYGVYSFIEARYRRVGVS